MMPQEFPITASTTDFPLSATLPNTPNAVLQGTDNFILQINGSSENGVPITIPGLNSDFGLYIEGTVAVPANPSVSIGLVLDPTNNDGTPSATWDPATIWPRQCSNPVNSADDIVVLATGSSVTRPHPHAALDRHTEAKPIVREERRSNMKLDGYGRLASQSRGHDNMRNQTYREMVMSHLRGVMLGYVAFLLSVGTGLACDNSSLNGVYPFTAGGYTMGIYNPAGELQYLNPPQPLSSVGQYTFDGHGNFTRVDFNVGNGVPVNNASTPVNGSGLRTGQIGTCSIGEDCTGTIALNANGAMINLQVVVRDSGLSARAIVASEHVPGFANPPPGTSCSSGCDEGVNILVDLKKDVSDNIQ